MQSQPQGPQDERAPHRRDRGPGPIERAAIPQTDSRSLPLRSARCRTTARGRTIAPKKFSEPPGVLEGKVRSAPLRTRSPSTLIRCESMQGECARQPSSRSRRLSLCPLSDYPFCRLPLPTSRPARGGESCAIAAHAGGIIFSSPLCGLQIISDKIRIPRLAGFIQFPVTLAAVAKLQIAEAQATATGGIK